MKPAIKNFLMPIAVFIFCCSVGNAPASDEDEAAFLDIYGDEEMISIATGNRQPISKAPAIASVLTANQISAIGATDIDDILETIPGLHVSRDNVGYNPLYLFRGIYSAFNPQVLMLINGIPITNLFQGDRNQIWGGMPINAISRIEVIRGPGSAVYGADAFAGVINIITKESQEIDGTQVGARIGSYQSRDLWVLHGGSLAGIDVALILEYHRTEGQDEVIEADAQSIRDSTTNTNASLAPGPLSLERNNLDLRAEFSYDAWRLRAGLQRRRDWGIGTGIVQALDPNNRYTSDRWNIDLTYQSERLFTDWDITAQISYLDTTEEVEKDLVIYPPGAFFLNGIYPDGVIGNPEVFERHSRFDISTFYFGLNRHQLRFGAGYYYGDLYKVRESKNFGIDPTSGTELLPAGGSLVEVSDTPYVFLKEGDRANRYIFAQDIWKIANDWEFTIGVRYDDYSDFGNTLNPRLALVWSARRDLTVKLLYGEAFRSPSFVQTRAINNPSVLGNPDLEPETIESFEIAFDYRPFEKLRIGLNLFRYNWEEIIQFVPDSGQPTSTAQNAGQQTGKGFELESVWDVSNTLTLSANYALQHATDEDADQAAVHAPRQQLYLSFDWNFFASWHLNSRFNWVLDRKRDSMDPRADIDDYRLVDMTLRWLGRSDTWDMGITVRNLFDSDARAPSSWSEPGQIANDLPLPRRSFFGEIHYRYQ